MADPITVTRETDHVVVRIPISTQSRVVIAPETIQGEYPAGWAVQAGRVTAACQLVERAKTPRDAVGVDALGFPIFPEGSTHGGAR